MGPSLPGRGITLRLSLILGPHFATCRGGSGDVSADHQGRLIHSLIHQVITECEGQCQMLAIGSCDKTTQFLFSKSIEPHKADED